MSVLSNTSLKSLHAMDEDERDGSVLDVTSVSLNNEQEPLLYTSTGYKSSPRIPPSTWKEKVKEFCYGGVRGRACFPRDPSYELVENFPCLFTPYNYFIKERLPIVKWLTRYSLRYLISDIIAGLTVGLMVVPQALAYASIAGLPLEVSN